MNERSRALALGYQRGMADACDILGPIIAEQFNRIMCQDLSLACEYGDYDETQREYGLVPEIDRIEAKPQKEWTAEEQAAVVMHNLFSQSPVDLSVGTTIHFRKFERLDSNDGC